MIKIRDLHKSFGAKKVLCGVNVNFISGKTTTIFGVSGGGKSTIIKHIIGLMTPDHGTIEVNGISLDTGNKENLYKIRKTVGYLFQSGALFDSMNVKENVEFPLIEHTKLTPLERDRKIERSLELVGLKPQEVLRLYPHELSGGMRKRVGLARTIILDPQAILYDEPTSGLDPITSDRISQLILLLQQELGVTSVLISHDIKESFKCSDYIAMLFEGQIVDYGEAEKFKNSVNPIVRQFVEGSADGPIKFAND
ncbi:MAG: ATP-binding cassette domain-containing protein [Helicobacteraceae bacterium]|jgi:phospholipid/cholesterol/gamma-HCH transport system ATP-binding protein|nr:ATP-binding cassette domain-containing protein [Helicobacteraceae bacterium]